MTRTKLWICAAPTAPKDKDRGTAQIAAMYEVDNEIVDEFFTTLCPSTSLVVSQDFIRWLGIEDPTITLAASPSEISAWRSFQTWIAPHLQSKAVISGYDPADDLELLKQLGRRCGDTVLLEDLPSATSSVKSYLADYLLTQYTTGTVGEGLYAAASYILTDSELALLPELASAQGQLRLTWLIWRRLRPDWTMA